MGSFGWSYPPGVTGNELAIAGLDYERDNGTPCPKCGGATMEQGYHGDRWLGCDDCEHVTDLESLDDPDPDLAYDLAREARLTDD